MPSASRSFITPEFLLALRLRALMTEGAAMRTVIRVYADTRSPAAAQYLFWH